MERWSGVTAEFGNENGRVNIWRYSRQWWRFNGRKFLKALYLLARGKSLSFEEIVISVNQAD